jgi:O-antigen ligase
VFGTKQALGSVSAVFLVVALLRLARRRSLFDIAASAVAFACLIGSGSRGAGVMTAAAVACLLAARVRPHIAMLAIVVLLLNLILGASEIYYFASTGNSAIQAFGHSINLTERTYIWQYALTLWTDRPYSGFGLNGFWTQPAILSGFFRLHGWVLDNYHSGYVAIAMETGVIGFFLFSVVFYLVGVRLKYLMMRNVFDRLSFELTLGFFVMISTINLTETIYLRSTSFFSVLFTFLVVKVLSSPTAHEMRWVRRRASPAWHASASRRDPVHT